MTRQLATIRQIKDVLPIEGADAIEIAAIMGWRCVVKKGEFRPGDIGVYFEVDSFLPMDDRYEFLRKSSYRNNEYMDDGSGEKGKGFRIKTITLRGEISQGLILPLASFPELEHRALTVGADVTELLSVRKWEVPEYTGNMGVAIGGKPYGIPTTDEIRLQSMPEYLDAFRGKPYYISTKLDGTSCTVYHKDGVVGVCGRNEEYKEDAESSAMWAWVYKTKLKDKLLALGEDIAIQGEFCGAGIQKNRLKLNEPNLFVFDIIKLSEGGGKVGLAVMREYCHHLGLEAVPVEETGDSFDYDLLELLEKAKGKYASGLDKEGIVVRTLAMDKSTFSVTKENGSIGAVVRRLSFKVLNNDFLKKEKD
ncbi:MAG: RNA ligase (ATP) [Clostridiales bacterium]|nr:RNA ligase (ATP) [Clostridiales bacterium]